MATPPTTPMGSPPRWRHLRHSMMKKFEVFHEITPSFGWKRGSFPERYLHVATVACEELGEVFELTNHIDLPWIKNAAVVISKDCASLRGAGWLGPRSTSVGDMVR